MTAARTLARLAAGGTALANGMIHAAELDEHFHEARYMGILFAFAIVFLAMLGLALVQPPYGSPGERMGRLTRAAGVLLMAGLIVGYLLSRTSGLPGFREGWDDVGLTTVAMEVLVIGLLLADMGGPRSPRPLHGRAP